eukprot:5134385-Amphidinium_carterae.2
MIDYDEIQSAEAKPNLVDEPPPWWSTLLKYKPSGGITKEMCETRATWSAMEAGVRDAGYVGINLPLMYEPNPNKARNIAHDVRRGAIIEVMSDMGHDNFVAAIDDQIKSGDIIEWDDPEEEGAEPIAMEEPSFDMRVNYFVKLKLPEDIENAVWAHTDRIAVETTGRRLQAKLTEAFNSYREECNMRTKAHTAAIRHGFPSYTQRWFERPIYRYQQACSGLGPFSVLVRDDLER